MTMPPPLNLAGADFNRMPSRAAMGLPDSWTPSAADDFAEAVYDLPLDPGALAAIVERAQEPMSRRIGAGAFLALLGDTRISVRAPAMVEIEGGEALIGLDETSVDGVVKQYSDLGVRREWIEKEVPRHAVRISPYRIGRYLVTHSEYRAFLEECPDAEIPTSWSFGRYPTWFANHPVHGISSDGARRYAAWLRSATGRPFRLPTEAEWEFAAAGPEGREFPWGDAFDGDRANTLESGLLSTSPVGAFPKGRTPNGICDMAGNVEEYVADHYRPYPGGKVVADDLYCGNPRYAMTRGGAYTRFRDLARTRRRHGFIGRDIYPVGFRLAEDVAGR